MSVLPGEDRWLDPLPQRTELCRAQHAKAPVERRSDPSDDYARKPAFRLYLECQRERGHEGNHAAQWRNGWIEWTL